MWRPDVPGGLRDWLESSWRALSENVVSADTLLAVSLTRAEPPLAEQVRAARRAGVELIELRVDRIGDDHAVEALLQQPHAVPFILTVRAAADGGAWTGDEARRIALLGRLARHHPGFVDVEYAAWQRSAELRRRAAAEGTNRLIVSHHDLQSTPSGLDDVLDRVAALPADVVKVAFTAGDALDACRVLEQLHRRGGVRPLIALAIGEAGLLTRVLARKFGAFLTFAALERGTESAPGQPTIGELRKLYRWDAIGPRTRVFGVVGWPVTHSLSPRMHNAAMTAQGIDGVYLPLPVKPTYSALAAFLDYVTARDWLDVAGLSVTMPHKQHAYRWLVARGYEIGELARRCGAVNTLVRDPEGSWRGENTDATGALAALESVSELAGRMVDVLGAGGVARAIVAALVKHGCQVTIYNRSASRARALAQQLRCTWKPWKQRSAGGAEILINCTSVGMGPDGGVLPIGLERLRPQTIVFDTVYNPPETSLLRAARARGCRVLSGVELFVGQGAGQHALWHGQPAPVKVMREALRARL